MFDLTLPFASSCTLVRRMVFRFSILAASSASAATSRWLANSASYLACSSAFSAICAVACRFAPCNLSAESGLNLSRRLETGLFEGDTGGADACEGDCNNEGETASVSRGVSAGDVLAGGSGGVGVVDRSSSHGSGGKAREGGGKAPKGVGR